MSSFNVNGPSNRPAIQEAQSMLNNGGAGNLGYMQGGHKQKDKEEEPVILEEEIADSFERSNDEDDAEEENDEINGFFEKLFLKIKIVIKNLFSSGSKKEEIKYCAPAQSDSTTFITLSKKEK